jgi:hypothetical protein
MCGRVTQKSPPNQLGLRIVDLIEPGDDVYNPTPPRFNGAPGQQHWVIRRHPETGQRRLDGHPLGDLPYSVPNSTVAGHQQKAGRQLYCVGACQWLRKDHTPGALLGVF